jgi:hypothetical protein
MPKIILKTDYTDGEILYGRQLNLDNKLTEEAINAMMDEFQAIIEKVTTIEEGAQVNKIEKVAGVGPDANKNVPLQKGNIGLGNVDNTADIDKPVSDPVRTFVEDGLSGKVDSVDVERFLTKAIEKKIVERV